MANRKIFKLLKLSFSILLLRSPPKILKKTTALLLKVRLFLGLF